MSLLQMSVTGGVMILAITVLRALAINHVPKKTFLALWGAALLRLVLPVSLSSTLSIYSLLGQKTALNVVDVPAAATPALLPGQAVAALPQIDAAPVQTISVWSIVWIAGVVLCAAFFAAVYWKCCREFRMSFPVDNDASRQWLQTHPLRRGICIRQSDQISSPLTFGVLHPVILMPKKTDWNDETALQYVLEHEFVHIRRFDAVSKLLLIAAACVHWFNPLVWVMYVLANRDMELSCDESVVRRFGSDARASYANILISMEETRSGFAPLCNHFSRNAIEERDHSNYENEKNYSHVSASGSTARSRNGNGFCNLSENRGTQCAGQGDRRSCGTKQRGWLRRLCGCRNRRTAGAERGICCRRHSQTGNHVVLSEAVHRHDLRRQRQYLYG